MNLNSLSDIQRYDRLLLSNYYYESINYLNGEELKQTYETLGISILPANVDWTHKSLECTTETLQSLLGSNDGLFLIPGFQSDYSDEAEQIKETLSSLVSILTSYPLKPDEVYFTGNIVVAAVYGVSPFNNQRPASLKANVIIDGKHRVMNFILCMMALYAICDEIKPFDRTDTALAKWINNRLEDLKQSLLSCFTASTYPIGSREAGAYMPKVMSSQTIELQIEGGVGLL